MVNLNTRTPADGCEGNGDGDYGCPDGTYNPDEPSELTRGPILDLVLDEEAKLQIYAAKVRDDQAHSDCSTSLDGDCHNRETLIFVDTVRGRGVGPRAEDILYRRVLLHRQRYRRRGPHGDRAAHRRLRRGLDRRHQHHAGPLGRVRPGRHPWMVRPTDAPHGRGTTNAASEPWAPRH